MRKKPRRFRQWQRLLEIMTIILHFRLDTCLLPAFICFPLHLLFRLHPRHRSRVHGPLPPSPSKKNLPPHAHTLCQALEALGPIFIKFGQLLSTRRDLFSDSTIHAFSKLQDNVTPFSGDLAREKIETHLGGPIANYLTHFDPIPLAAASIAQVHAATRHNGEHVVIKVTRPGILSIIEQDIAIMRLMAAWIAWIWPNSYKFHIDAVIDEFEHNLEKEIDLMYEASNAAQLTRYIQQANLPMAVPHMIWQYATPHVLMMQRMHGLPINDLPALKAKGICTKQLAQTLLDVFFTQALHFGFFHADMHPGNLLVKPPVHPQQPATLIAVDFGIMGTLSPQDQYYLSENLVAFYDRNYRQVAALHIASGWVPANTRIDIFEAAIRQVCEPLFAQPLKQVSLGQLLARLLQTAHQFHMEVLPQLLLLQKTILQVESLSRHLDPDLDLWASTEHVVSKWLKNQMGWQGAFKKIRHNLPFWLEKLPDIPALYYRYLENASRAGGASAAATLASSALPPVLLQHHGHTANPGIAMITQAQHIASLRRTQRWAALRASTWSSALLLGSGLYLLPSTRLMHHIHPIPNTIRYSLYTLLLIFLLSGWIGHVCLRRLSHNRQA